MAPTRQALFPVPGGDSYEPDHEVLTLRELVAWQIGLERVNLNI